MSWSGFLNHNFYHHFGTSSPEKLVSIMFIKGHKNQYYFFNYNDISLIYVCLIWETEWMTLHGAWQWWCDAFVSINFKGSPLSQRFSKDHLCVDNEIGGKGCYDQHIEGKVEEPEVQQPVKIVAATSRWTLYWCRNVLFNIVTMLEVVIMLMVNMQKTPSHAMLDKCEDNFYHLNKSCQV